MFKSLSTLRRVNRQNFMNVYFFIRIINLFFQQALKGEVGMSNELDDLARALFNGQLPSMWRRLAPATKKNLANWMDHFFKRNNQYNTWVIFNMSWNNLKIKDFICMLYINR